jgi:nucleoside-diphosphate-sugar epimerase
MAVILIVGCGSIGFPVAQTLHDKGHRVVGLKRRPSEACTPFSLIAGDICRPLVLMGLPRHIDLIVFVVSPGNRDAAAYQALYQTGLQNVLNYFQVQGTPPKWLMVSSSSVYGQRLGEWVDEISEVKPDNAASRYLLAAEQTLSAGNTEHCVVRFSGIYGPGRDWLIRRVASAEPIQRFPPLYTNRIHHEDCVAVLLFLIGKLLAGETLARCYLASDDDPAPLWDVVEWIAQKYGFSQPHALESHPGAAQNKRCSNARLSALGYKFLFPSYRDGYSNTM